MDIIIYMFVTPFILCSFLNSVFTGPDVQFVCHHMSQPVGCNTWL